MGAKQRRQSSIGLTRAIENFANYVPPRATLPSTSNSYFIKSAQLPSPVQDRPLLIPKMPSRTKPSSTTAFKPVPVTRPVRYAPYELEEGEHTSLTPSERSFLHSEWKRFRVRQYTSANFLLGEVAYTVPYNGNGQGGPTLENLTGKKRFDFFAYTFVMPGKNEEWSILWDYETGLVRTAGIFKPLGHVKSAPKIALESSTGLLQIAANVNGGRVDLQGYWVPFKAAFELSTKFAHELRAVLYPIFGPSILRGCVPSLISGSVNFTISPDTVRDCKRDLIQLSRSLLPPANDPTGSTSAPTTALAKRPKRKPQDPDGDTTDTTDEETQAGNATTPESDDYICPSSSSPSVTSPVSPKSSPEAGIWKSINRQPFPSPSPTVRSTHKSRRPGKRALIPRSAPRRNISKRPATGSSKHSTSLSWSRSITNDEGPDKGQITAAANKIDHTFCGVPVALAPHTGSWSDIGLRHVLLEHADGEKQGFVPQLPTHGQYGAGRTDKMYFEDLKAALWLTEMAKGENIAGSDDVEVLKQALRLGECEWPWLQEVIEDLKEEMDLCVETDTEMEDAEGETDD